MCRTAGRAMGEDEGAVVPLADQAGPVPSARATTTDRLACDVYEPPTTTTRGDVAAERKLVERMRELGLLDTKTSLERMLLARLDRRMDESDAATRAMWTPSRRCRRRRPLREHVAATALEIQHAIRSEIGTNEAGERVYKVSLLMGHFTRDVKHSVAGSEVTVSSATLNDTATRLTKETRVEFPSSVDMSALHVTYRAGVVRLQVPFRQQPGPASPAHRTWSDSSGYDTKSDVSVTSPTADSDDDDCDARPVANR